MGGWVRLCYMVMKNQVLYLGNIFQAILKALEDLINGLYTRKQIFYKTSLLNSNFLT
jgi:hypothetical protein